MNIVILQFLFVLLVIQLVNSWMTIEDRERRVWRDCNTNNDTSIRPFTVRFSKEIVDDLKWRIKNHRKFTPPLKGAAFTYGVNTNILDGWLDHWANKYDFRARENYFNKFPQYKTYIQGLDIHFIWVKPKVPTGVKIIPLLLLHGFPGSVREFYESIPLLTAFDKNRPFAVEVIIPSLPGFGFSDGATIQGCGDVAMATVFKLLMQRLGHHKFYIQGGDWGSFIGSVLSTLYPEVVLGFHTNFAVARSPIAIGIWFAGSFSPSLVVKPSLQDRLYPLSKIFKMSMRELGYFHEQATKPDTVGVGMADSPAGLLVWLLQQWSTASRGDNIYKDNGGLDLYTYDEILDNVMMYWVPNSFTTSVRIYAESFNIKVLQEGVDAKPTSVPVWTVHTKDEIIYLSPAILKAKYTNILNSTVYDTYGHFFAFEAPEEFSKNVLTALGSFIKWHSRQFYSKHEL